MTDTLADFARSQAASLRNQQRLSGHRALRTWIAGCRLDAYSKQFASIRPEDTELVANAERFRKHIGPALQRLQQLLA
jgi:hypothetical protein